MSSVEASRSRDQEWLSLVGQESHPRLTAPEEVPHAARMAEQIYHEPLVLLIVMTANYSEIASNDPLSRPDLRRDDGLIFHWPDCRLVDLLLAGPERATTDIAL